MARTTFGGHDLLRAARLFEANLLEKIEEVVYNTARLIESEAKARAPVNLGSLRASIESEKIDRFKYKVISAANYSIFVEWGSGIYASMGNGRTTPWTYYSEELQRFVTTRGSKPQEFWFPAIEIGERYFNREMRNLGL